MLVPSILPKVAAIAAATFFVTPPQGGTAQVDSSMVSQGNGSYRKKPTDGAHFYAKSLGQTGLMHYICSYRLQLNSLPCE